MPQKPLDGLQCRIIKHLGTRITKDQLAHNFGPAAGIRTTREIADAMDLTLYKTRKLLHQLKEEGIVLQWDGVPDARSLHWTLDQSNDNEPDENPVTEHDKMASEQYA